MSKKQNSRKELIQQKKELEFLRITATGKQAMKLQQQISDIKQKLKQLMQ
jgi:hypothetical protein